jgi:hypothetical protein
MRVPFINDKKKGLVTTCNRCDTIPKLGSKFLHPRMKMYRSASNTLHSIRSKEDKGVLPDKIRRMQILETRVSRQRGQSQTLGKIGHLQDNLQKANIMVHFLALFFLHPKALFYTPF